MPAWGDRKRGPKKLLDVGSIDLTRESWDCSNNIVSSPSLLMVCGRTGNCSESVLRVQNKMILAHELEKKQGAKLLQPSMSSSSIVHKSGACIESKTRGLVFSIEYQMRDLRSFWYV
jgi:hypothetical protein